MTKFTVASETLEGMFLVNNSPNTQHMAHTLSAKRKVARIWDTFHTKVPIEKLHLYDLVMLLYSGSRFSCQSAAGLHTDLSEDGAISLCL